MIFLNKIIGWKDTPMLAIGVIIGTLIRHIGLYSAVTIGVAMFFLVKAIIFRIDTRYTIYKEDTHILFN